MHVPNGVRLRMLEVARNLRRSSTPGEQILWQHLRGRRVDGRKFRRQHANGTFVVDFFCSDERLIVEVDGGIHESQRSADQERQQILESLGYRVIRVSDDLVRTDIERVLTSINTNLTPQAPPLRSTERGPRGEVRTRKPPNQG
ncbi:MAG: endonuclease domain-containing protein [Dehalococcoidia bacterium]